jgi:uncharacterized protein (TIGR03083 family)
VQTKDADLTRLYRDTQERVAALVSTLDDETLRTDVAACPGWRVRDVVAHLAAVSEDAVAGRLTGPPTDEETAVQVARFADRTIAEILGVWAENTPKFAEILGAFQIWPGVIDVTSHEHDIRTAIGRPGARDSEAVWHCSQLLLSGLQPPVDVRVTVEDGQFGTDGAELELRTTRFDALRWRMGRRSRTQLAALDWSGDPAPVLDHLVVFGPSTTDIVE